MTFPQGPIKLGLSLAYGYNELDPPSYLSRYYLELNGVNSYISIPDMVLSGDFTIAYSCYYGVPPETEAHLGDFSSSTTYIGPVIGGGVFRVRLSGDNYDTTNGTIAQDVTSNIIITRTADSLLVTVNDAEVIDIESGVYTGDVTISSIGTYKSLSFPANCYMFDVGLADSAGTDDRFYAIDDGWSANPTITDSTSGQDGTAINVQEADWSMELS